LNEGPGEQQQQRSKSCAAAAESSVNFSLGATTEQNNYQKPKTFLQAAVDYQGCSAILFRR
jgi:hypothetical protein